MSVQSSTNHQTIATRPANAFGYYDSIPFALIDINRASNDEMAQHFRITPKLADQIIALRTNRPIFNIEQLQSIQDLPATMLDYIRGKALVVGDPRFNILNVTAQEEYLFSHQPFKLCVHFANPIEIPVAIVSVHILWAGEPFVVEKEVTAEEAQQGWITVEFDQERTLPVGLVECRVAVYRLDGAEASFRKSFYVLPSNPLSLSLSPAGATVTGTWSARGDYQDSSDSFLTECMITIANGDNVPVSMNRGVTWRFWDGGVGGTLVESGSFNWSEGITVPAFGTWRGNVWFSSPKGSGIYNKYHDKEDMAIEIEMTAGDRRRITGTITCRVMLAFGVNIIKVGNFDAQEGIDLYNAVDIMRQIYEQRDFTFRGVLRWIIDNQAAGSYTILNSESEFRNLLRDWSVSNDYVDVYVCQDFDWSSYNGYAGDIPGPASKGGDKDGVAVEKTGFNDSTGVRRLDTDVLSKLIGHEVGHYLGLSHVSDANNLMLANTGVRGPDLNYDQYRLMMKHGFVVFQ